MTAHTTYFRFYAELNDFLPPERRQRTFAHEIRGQPAVKDTIEALGVPHTEVDLILINGQSVGFDAQVQAGDRVAVYPVFESLDIGPVTRLRAAPLRRPAFVLDVHLGKLARLLRMLGFDARYHNDLSDPELVEIALRERRIILTRDVGLLKRGEVTHGYWVRSTAPMAQAREVVQRFDLRDRAAPFTRCIACNGELAPVDKAAVRSQLPPRVAEAHETFQQCRRCGKVYWRGSHYEQLRVKARHILTPPGETSA